MFDKEIIVTHKEQTKTIKIIELLTKIKRSKYPAITELEESISIPLQTLYCSIFDGILVYMMNKISDNELLTQRRNNNRAEIMKINDWQTIRTNLCNNLNLKKVDRTIEILETTYNNQDIIFLQEVASIFKQNVLAIENQHILQQYYHIYSPNKLDNQRDQNSFILLNKKRYNIINIKEITSEIIKELENITTTAPVVIGDLLGLTVIDSFTNQKYLLISFHGDTNGLATIPIVTAIHNYALYQKPDHRLLIGLDANTYEHPDNDQQGVIEFAKFYVLKLLNSCYGKTPNPKNYTTFHARTYLQPQLNKVSQIE